MHYVYVLRSTIDNTLYKGYTKDLRKRFEQHNGKKVKSTKYKTPWTLLYYEAFQSEQDARREELFLKSGKGRERLKVLFTE